MCLIKKKILIISISSCWKRNWVSDFYRYIWMWKMRIYCKHIFVWNLIEVIHSQKKNRNFSADISNIFSLQLTVEHWKFVCVLRKMQKKNEKCTLRTFLFFSLAYLLITLKLINMTEKLWNRLSVLKLNDRLHKHMKRSF